MIELFVLVLIVGALLGGNSFGSVVRNGCAFIVIGGALLVILMAILLYYTGNHSH